VAILPPILKSELGLDRRPIPGAHQRRLLAIAGWSWLIVGSE